MHTLQKLLFQMGEGAPYIITSYNDSPNNLNKMYSTETEITAKLKLSLCLALQIWH